MQVKEIITQLLSQAGISIGGPKPWDIQVYDERFYSRVFQDQHLGLGETYMEGWWNCQSIDELISRILKSQIENRLKITPKDIFYFFMHKLFNFQTRCKATEVAHKHYNIGNSLYRSMLGETMNYSCGYWKNASTLDEAQYNKMELICRKLDLKPGMKILDIGCGWGGLAKYAAEKYGVEVVGATISQPQKQFAEERCQGLPVQILLKDYRDLPKDVFDRVVSVGMFEHVGYKNYRFFMDVVSNRLTKEGIFLLHTIGGNISYVRGDNWVNKYIFPNGMLPSISQIGKALEGYFVMEDWHNFGVDYDKTLMAWHKNFNGNWNNLENGDERFKKMWNYYLLSCAGGFRSRSIQLWQVLLTKNGLTEGFKGRNL